MTHALALQESRLLAGRVRTRVELEDVPPVWAEAGQIDTLLRHLIDNARQAMAGGSPERTLTVRLSPVPAGVRLEVADEGPGIPAEHLPRIFNPFFTTKEEARGLGLSVAHGIVREHGGRLWAENCPGGGARFLVELPLGLRAAEVTAST